MSDTNWRSYYGDNPDTSGFVNPPNPQDFDDIMKFSGCTNVGVAGKEIAAGRENCVDAVQGSNYNWYGCSFGSGAGVSTFTLKGAIDAWGIESSLIGRGKQTDIELGQFDNYWKPGRKPTRTGATSSKLRSGFPTHLDFPSRFLVLPRKARRPQDFATVLRNLLGRSRQRTC